MKTFLFTIWLAFGMLLSLPAYAWPEVDHMNMCGSATKVVRSYQGSSQGFAQRDRYIAKRGNAYYFRTNCPETKAPVKAKAAKKPQVDKAVAAKKKVKKARPTVKKTIKRLRGTYDEHADCLRVDRVNGYGSPVKIIRRR